MRTVGAFHVEVLGWDGPQLVLAEDGEEACYVIARVRMGATTRAARKELVGQLRMTAEAVHPYHCRGRQGRGMWFFARDLHAARDKHPGEAIDTCTIFEALQSEDDHTLLWQIGYLWGFGNKPALYFRFAFMRDRYADGTVWKRLTRSQRQHICGMLALACSEPRLGALPGRGTLRKARGKVNRRDLLRVRVHGLHDDEVGPELVEEVLRRGAIGGIQPFEEGLRDALGKFAAAYGMPDLSWDEVSALWDGGVSGLEALRVRRRLRG